MTSREKNDDRISYLPDDVLCHVLSFVRTKDSVATSVLSKRWNHLWESVPNMSIDDSGMPSSQWVNFANFVNWALSLHTTNIRSLRFRQITLSYDVAKWVSKSIVRNIQCLDLKIYDGEARFQLPSSMFTCTALESLMLEGHILLVVPEIVCLPKLRTLKLVQLYYQDEDCAARLITSCSSSLESVFVHNIHCNKDVGIYNICHAKFQPQILRHLNLESNVGRKKIKVPSHVFTCQSLEKLSLRGSFFICAPPTICLPNLTSLALSSVTYEDDQILNRLISSCTYLESLSVGSSVKADLNISSSTLKQIMISFYSNRRHKIVINAPCLKCFTLQSHGRVDYHIEDLASLEEAFVLMGFEDRGIIDDYYFSTLKNVYQAIQHVKRLRACHFFVKGCDFGGALPTFNRLTDLDIIMPIKESGVLLELITNSTKLINLTLEASYGHNWEDPITVPACLLTTLRNVTIRHFVGGVGETLMAKYILANARILEKMEIRFSSTFNIESELNVCEKIFGFNRGSDKCLVNLMTSLHL